jgi:hypothetical protein
MKSIKHSKIRNTGILFELLTRQIASDVMNSKNSKAISIVKKFFNVNTELGKELKLYKTLSEEKFQSETASDKFISATISARKKLDTKQLSEQKYKLIKEIKNNFDINDFFAARVSNYQVQASIYKLFEFAEVDNPAEIVRSKTTLSEHICNKHVADKDKPLVQEFYRNQDKDVRLLSTKLLIDKFNSKYEVLSESQKKLLREFVNNVSETKSLKDFVAQQIPALRKTITKYAAKVDDRVLKIKINEVVSMLNKIEAAPLVKDRHILSVLRYMELADELKAI